MFGASFRATDGQEFAARYQPELFGADRAPSNATALRSEIWTYLRAHNDSSDRGWSCSQPKRAASGSSRPTVCVDPRLNACRFGSSPWHWRNAPPGRVGLSSSRWEHRRLGSGGGGDDQRGPFVGDDARKITSVRQIVLANPFGCLEQRAVPRTMRYGTGENLPRAFLTAVLFGYEDHHVS